MSSKSKRRIRPHERARVDQALAAASERGAHDPTTAVMMIEYADPGTPCCWCDCAIEDHRDGKICPGCSDEAMFVYHTRCGTPEHRAYPVCRQHRGDYIEFVQTWMFPNIHHEFTIYDAYDPDIHE